MSKKGKKIKRLKYTVKVLNDKVEIQKELIHWQRTENAELRELVRDIYVQYDGILDWAEIERRMSKLGIEAES